MLKRSRKVCTTSSASPARSRPWSTKMQVSWSPIASWISTAATEESTPPDRPQITRPSPTCARMRAICAARNPAMVQSPEQPAIVVGEVAQQLRAVRRVHHLGMELHAVEAAAVVGDGGEGRALAGGHHAEAGRQAGHPVAMAHPHLLARARRPDAVEQGAGRRHVEIGAAELAVLGALHLAAELGAHGLLAVADAEHRHAGARTLPAARAGNRLR